MTDNDIIKALECCRKPVGQACKECPLNSKGVDCLDFDIDELILDLINRQKAEIDRLNSELKATSGAALSYKAELERLTGKRTADPMDFCGVLCRYSEELITKAKAEAVKEFAEKVKKHCEDIIVFDDWYEESKLIDYIDNLVKEMVGES